MTDASFLHRRDRAVIDLIYHHPVAHNLPWRDVLRLIAHIGRIEQKHDGKWIFEINRLQRTFRTPHGVHLEPDAVVKLREFLGEAGLMANSRGEPYLGGQDPAAVKMVVLDHRAASVYELRDGACTHIASLRPHDPHHFLHHLTHRDQPHYRGQRSTEDPTFYDSLISALRGSEVAVLIGNATGASAAIEVLAQWLRRRGWSGTRSRCGVDSHGYIRSYTRRASATRTRSATQPDIVRGLAFAG